MGKRESSSLQGRCHSISGGDCEVEFLLLRDGKLEVRIEWYGDLDLDLDQQEKEQERSSPRFLLSDQDCS